MRFRPHCRSVALLFCYEGKTASCPVLCCSSFTDWFLHFAVRSVNRSVSQPQSYVAVCSAGRLLRPQIPATFSPEKQTDLVSHPPSLQRYACASPALYQLALDSAVLDGSLTVFPVRTSVKRTINQQFRPVPSQRPLLLPSPPGISQFALGSRRCRSQ